MFARARSTLRFYRPLHCLSIPLAAARIARQARQRHHVAAPTASCRLCEASALPFVVELRFRLDFGLLFFVSHAISANVIRFLINTKALVSSNKLTDLNGCVQRTALDVARFWHVERRSRRSKNRR